MKEQGFTQSDGDPCVFRKAKKDQAGRTVDELIVGCYVDDLCICHGPTGEHIVASPV